MAEAPEETSINHHRGIKPPPFQALKSLGPRLNQEKRWSSSTMLLSTVPLFLPKDGVQNCSIIVCLVYTNQCYREQYLQVDFVFFFFFFLFRLFLPLLASFLLCFSFLSLLPFRSKGTQLEWGIGRRRRGWRRAEWAGYYPTVRFEWRAPLSTHKRSGQVWTERSSSQ